MFKRVVSKCTEVAVESASEVWLMEPSFNLFVGASVDQQVSELGRQVSFGAGPCFPLFWGSCLERIKRRVCHAEEGVSGL